MQSVKCQKLLSISSFDCDIYSDERKELEESVENILAMEGMNCSVVDMKVLSGDIEGLNKQVP